MEKKQQKKQKQQRKANDFSQSDEEIMNWFNAKKQQDQKSKKPKQQDNSSLIPEQKEKISKETENQNAQKKQNPNEVVSKNPLNQTQKNFKSNQTIAVLRQPQPQKQNQNQQSQNLKREKQQIRQKKQEGQQNNVPKKQQKEPKKEQRGEKKQLHEDSDLFSHKYQIRKLQTRKGRRAPSQFDILDKNRRPLSIMAWNVWGDYHERQQNDRQARYRCIINEINTKKPDIVCLQEMQKFREQPYFVNLLQSIVGSQYYYAEPSFNSTIILCKTNANFYEVKFAKGLKTKPMTVCTFNMKCSDDGKIRQVVVHSVHLKSRVEEGTRPIRELQLRTIHKINKKFDVNIMAGDFNFDDMHPQDVEVRYSYLDLQHHQKNKNREDLLPENRPVEKMRMQPQEQMMGRQENVGHLDGFLGYLSDIQSWDSSDMEKEFESEDSFDGYSVSWWSDSSGGRNQDFSEDYSSGSHWHSDQDDDDDSDEDDEQSDDMSEQESPSDQGSYFNDSSGDQYGDYQYDQGPRYSRNNNYQSTNEAKAKTTASTVKLSKEEIKIKTTKIKIEIKGEKKKVEGEEKRRAQRERIKRQRQNRRQQRGRQRERSRQRHPHPDRPRFILPRNEEDAIWTHMYCGDKSLNRFDRILMFCPEYSKRALMKKANVVKFERLGIKGVGRYIQEDCMLFLRDKIVRTPSDHFGVFANMFLNFHSV